MNRRTIIAASLAILLPVAATLLLAPDAIFPDVRPLFKLQTLSEIWNSTVKAVGRSVRHGWKSVAGTLDRTLTRIEREQTASPEEVGPLVTYERQIRGARVLWRLTVVLCLLAVLRIHYRRRGGIPHARKRLLHREWTAQARALDHRASSMRGPVRRG